MTRIALTALSFPLLFACSTANEELEIEMGSGALTATGNAAPVTTIYEPINGARYMENSDVTISLGVLDPDNLPREHMIRIRSDADGRLGRFRLDPTSSLETQISDLSPGMHTLVLLITDAAGNLDRREVDIEIMENQAPTSPMVEIGPYLPSADEDLQAIIVDPAVDPEGQPLTYVWSWQADGVDMNWDSELVPADMTKEGQVWTVSVYATDGDLSSPVVQSSIAIGTGGPEVTVSVTPKDPYVDDAIVCDWSAGDPYGLDMEIDVGWYLHGEYMADANEPLTNAFVKGDVVTCEVIAETERGVTVVSDSTRVLNSAPVVDLVSINPVSTSRANPPVCNAEASDMDNDVLVMEWSWYVNSAEVSNEQALSQDFFSKDDSIWCMARVSDDEVTTSWLSSGILTVDNSAPSAPTVELDAGISLGNQATCEVVVDSVDADGDSLSYLYQWFLDGELVQEGADDTLTVGDAGEYSCAARGDDGEDLGDWGFSAPIMVD